MKPENPLESGLSRREREIMEIVFALGGATATDVVREMADPPSRTAVRTTLRIMEEKGHLTHEVLGREYVYRPLLPRKTAGGSALRKVLNVFFDGSVEDALATHLSHPATRFKKGELARLKQLIEEAKKRGE